MIDQPSGSGSSSGQCRDDLAVLVQDDATHAAARADVVKRLPTARRRGRTREREEHWLDPSARREGAPRPCAHTAGTRSSLRRSLARPPSRPAKRNTPERTTARRPGGRPVDETMRNGRGRERVAQHRPTAEQVGRPTRENTNATQHDDTSSSRSADCRGRAGGSNRGRYSPQCATALAGSPKPLEPTQLLIRSPRRRGRGASGGTARPSTEAVLRLRASSSFTAC